MTSTASAAVPKEKWADRVRIFSGSPARPRELGQDEISALLDCSGLPELANPKTEIETAAIAEVAAALNEYCQIMCGLGQLAFPAERVHLYSEEDFAKKSGGRFDGKGSLGHVQLRRGWPMADLLALLAHEMFHAVSYLWLDLWEPDAVSCDGIKWPFMTQRRAGMVLIDPSWHTWLPHFHGLNEGVTEMSAMVVRQMIAKRSKLLDEAGRQRLARFVVSDPLVAFTERLLAVASGPGHDTIAALRLLVGDCLKGTDEFLTLLETKQPGATAILRCTGATPRELAVAATSLGFSDLARAISACCVP